MDVEIAIRVWPAPSIVDELDGHIVRAGAEGARQGDVLGLASGVRRAGRQRTADLLAVHRDGELRSTLVAVARYAQDEGVGAGSNWN